MNTIETSIQDSDLLWNNFDQYEESLYNSFKINGLAISVWVIECVVAIGTEYIPISDVDTTVLISALALSVLFISNITLLQNHQFFKNRVVKLIVKGVAVLITVIAIYYLKGFAILPIFQGMCHYSAYLQLEGLTYEKLGQLKVQDLINQITSPQDKVKRSPFGLIFSINNLKDYLQVKVLHDPFYSFRKDIPDLLDLGYNQRKILSFTLSSISDNMVLFSLGTRYHDAVRKQFEVSVDYLIRCKKLHPDLDESFVNAQLKYLGYLNRLISAPCHLTISNGIPIIIDQSNELGDVSELKQKLADCFGTVIQI